MFVKKSILLILPLILLSCSVQQPSAPTGTTDTSNTTDNQNTTINSALKFNKISDKNKNIANNVAQQGAGGNVAESATASRNVTPAMAPSVGATSDMAIAPSSKMIAPGYYPRGGGNFEEYIILNAEEATTEGFNGTYLDAFKKVVKPILSSWARDARLTYSNGNADNNGKNNGSFAESYESSYQWVFNYASAEKKETYNIMISSKETLVIRQRWIIKNLNADEIKVDTTEAIKLYVSKISDKQTKASDNQETYVGPNAEILYALPDKVTWNFYLNQEESGLVWNVNMNINIVNPRPVPMATPVTKPSSTPGQLVFKTPEPPQTYENIWYSGGYARINAKTGEVLSFTRPVKYTEKISYQPPYQGEPVYRVSPLDCDDNGNCKEIMPATQPAPAVETAKPSATIVN